MGNRIFINKGKGAIRELLKEIGPYRFERALEEMKLERPGRMEGFYLEARPECIFLCFRYRWGTRRIMKVERYGMPHEGWELYYEE